MTTHPVPVGPPADEPLPRRTPGLVYAQLAEADWQALCDARRGLIIPDPLVVAMVDGWSEHERDHLAMWVNGYAPGALVTYQDHVLRERARMAAITAERFAPVPQ